MSYLILKWETSFWLISKYLGIFPDITLTLISSIVASKSSLYDFNSFIFILFTGKGLCECSMLHLKSMGILLLLDGMFYKCESGQIV